MFIDMEREGKGGGEGGRLTDRLTLVTDVKEILKHPAVQLKTRNFACMLRNGFGRLVVV